MKRAAVGIEHDYADREFVTKRDSAPAMPVTCSNCCSSCSARSRCSISGGAMR